MTLLVPMAVQIDGEAWTWPASTISITHQNQSRLLLNKNKDKKGLLFDSTMNATNS